MAKSSKKRQQYTEAQRKKILAAAQANDLTANQVKKRFGVTPVTYYSWRKKAKLPPMPRGRRPTGGMVTDGRSASAKLSAAAERGLRGQIRQRIDAMVREEIQRALHGLR